MVKELTVLPMETSMLVIGRMVIFMVKVLIVLPMETNT